MLQIPVIFWTKCVLTATYLINKLSSLVLNDKSPFSLVYGRERNLSHLRSFGCLCFDTVVKGSDTFSHRSEKCVLIGYASGKKAYKLFSLENRNVLYSRDVKFFETIFPYKMSNNESVKEFDNVSTINIFDHFEVELETKPSNLSPDDEEEGSHGRDGIEFTKKKSDCVISDFDWAECPVTRRSMASTACEIMWIVKILREFGIENVVPAELFCDNKSAIQIVANHVRSSSC
ncbi:ribonuclease H-like domain-containing protein [Tanacetum coccineum]